jgi:hypothetical protein
MPLLRVRLARPPCTPPSKRKPDHERDPSNRVVQVPRTTQIHARYVPSSPSSPSSCCSTSLLSPSALLSLAESTPRNSVIDLTLSPSPPSRAHRRRRSGTPEIVVKSEPTMLSYLPKPAVTSVDADTDDRWARGLGSFRVWNMAGRHLRTGHGLGIWSHIKWLCLG